LLFLRTVRSGKWRFDTCRSWSRWESQHFSDITFYSTVNLYKALLHFACVETDAGALEQVVCSVWTPPLTLLNSWSNHWLINVVVQIVFQILYIGRF
jgi:hypothetical protein